MNINIDIKADQLMIDTDRDELIDFIKELDLKQADWDFTGKLLVHFFKAFENEFVKSEYPEEDLTDEEKKNVQDVMKMLERIF